MYDPEIVHDRVKLYAADITAQLSNVVMGAGVEGSTRTPTNTTPNHSIFSKTICGGFELVYPEMTFHIAPNPQILIWQLLVLHVVQPDAVGDQGTQYAQVFCSPELIETYQLLFE